MRICRFLLVSCFLRRQGFQVFHLIVLFATAKPETETCVVVIHNVEQCGESAVVKESAFCVGPDSIQRGCAIAMVLSASGLEVVDADVASFVLVPARIAKDW